MGMENLSVGDFYSAGESGVSLGLCGWVHLRCVLCLPARLVPAALGGPALQCF
jgi:hypothetical protein